MVHFTVGFMTTCAVKCLSTLDAFAAGTQYLILDAGGKNVTI
jgi:hypothetical protein